MTRIRSVLPVILATAVLSLAGAPAGAIPAAPGSPPNFAHPDDPHYTYHSVESGRNARPVLVIYQHFDELPLPAGRDAGWAARRFFGDFPSVVDFFEETSFGALTFTRASETNTAAGGAANDGIVVVDAGSIVDFDALTEPEQNRDMLARVDDFVDFSSFDRPTAGDPDGDGIVTPDELTVVRMNVAKSDAQFCGATRSVEQGTTVDGVLLDRQRIAQGVTNTNIVTHAHEFMHAALGLERDWYQYKMETFDVMGETCRPPNVPERFYGVNAWNKMHLGWITPTVVTTDGYRTIRRADRNPEAFLLYDPDKAEAPTEHYLLVENRVRGDMTYDQDVGDSGLAIWRIDETRYYQDPADALPIWLTRPCWGDPATGEGGRTDCPDGWYTDIWDPATASTPQRTMEIKWRDGTDSNVAVRAIGAAGDEVTAFFDVPGPGVLVDPSTPDGRPMEVRIVPDEPTFVRFPVMNTGDVPDEFRFTATGLPFRADASTDVQDLRGHEASTTAVLITLAADTPTGLHRARARGASLSVSEEAPFDLRVVLDRTEIEYTGATTAPTGQPAGLRAVVTNPDDPGAPPVPGERVTFELKGPGGTQVASAVTDAAGVATADPTLTLPPGEYTLTVSVPRLGKHGPAVVQADYAVERRPAALVYVGDISGQYSDPTTLTARLTDALTGAPLAGRDVDLTIGSQSATAAADLDGRASAQVVLDQGAGAAPLRVAFGGDSRYLPASAETTYEIRKESLTLSYDGDTLVGLPGQPALAAHAVQEGDGTPGDLSLADVVFELSPTLGTSSASFGAASSDDGRASTVAADVGADLWKVSASIPASNDYWVGATTHSTELAVFDPARRLGGEAWGTDVSGERAKVQLADVFFASGAWSRKTKFKGSSGIFEGESYDWVIAAGGAAILQVDGVLGGVPATLRLLVHDAGPTGDAFSAEVSSLLGTSYDSGHVVAVEGDLRIE